MSSSSPSGVSITISASNQVSPVLRSIQEELLGLRQPLQVLDLFRSSFGGVTSSIVQATTTIGFFGQGMSTLRGLVSNGPFQLLIGQTIELQDQLLSTAATLVGTSKIISNGFEIKDAQQAILALNQPLNDQIRQLKQESLELVGVTSKELVPVFQQVASGITPIGATLTDARGLTLSFAAALGTLRVPLYQSQQEIQSIFQGTIDQNSVLAKSLNINNDMVNKWKAQGILVGELTKRLEPFREGNKLASQSFAGVTSNIQEVFDLIGQRAGEKLLAPLVQGLTEVYNFLNANTELIVAEAGKVTDQFLRAGLAFQSILKTIFGDVTTVFKDVPLFLFTSLANALEALNQGLGFTMAVLRPALNLFSVLSGAIAPLASGFLVVALQVKALGFGVKLLTSAFGVLGSVLLPGVGQILPLLAANAGALGAAFTGLGGATIFSSVGMAQFSANLQGIPGAMTLMASATAALGNLLRTVGLAVVAFGAFKIIDEFILKNKGLMEVLGGVFGGLGEVVNILIGSWQSALITSTVVVGGLAIAFRAQLIPAVLSFISIQLAGAVTSSASAFVFLAGALNSLGFSSMAVTAGTAALHLQMLSASASLGTLTMGGLALAVKSVALSVATLLAPLAAVAAVVGGIGLVLYSQSLKDSIEATQELANRTEEYGDLAIDSLEKLSVAQKKQQESEKSGIRLTDEEYKNNQKLQNQAKLRIGLLEDQITTLKEQEKTVKDANKSNIQSQIAELERLKTSLNQLSSDIKIEPKDLPVLGSTLEQLKKKADQAMQAILKPSGDPEIFKKKASEVIELNMALLAMGQTIDKDVITKLRQLSTDTRLDQEVQRKAQETITKIIEQESQSRLAVIARQKSETEAQQKNGEIGVRESEKLITDLTIKELEERKSAQQEIQSEQRAFGNIEAARKAGEEIKKIESDITKAIAEERSKRNEELVKNFQEQQSIIEGYLAQGLTTEKNYNNQKSQLQIEGLDEQIRQQRNKLGKLAGDDKEGREAINAEIGKLQVQRQKTIKDGYDQELSALEKQLQKTVDLVKEAELIRQSEVQKSFNEFGGDQNLINEENVKNNLKTLEAEYSKTVKELNETKSQPALSDPRLETDRQTKIRKLRQEQLQQSLGMLKVEKEAWDAHTQTVLGNIAKENNAQLLSIEKQINSGNVLRELEGAASATDKVQELQVLLSREKDVNKQAELRLSLEKAIREEREAWGALGIAEIEAINNIELIALKNLLNQGKILKEEYDLKIAQQAIETLQKRISLETDVGKKIKLQLQLVEAQGQLIDANVRRYEAGLNKEAQAYENTIKRQNNELDNQSRKFDILNKALQMRSELQDAQKGVFDAASSFYSGELDALVQGERSERKKKQLAELISAIKLKSAIQQAEFDKQSLISQQLMKNIEIEREKIAAKRALNDAKIEKRKADNALKVAKKDPRTTPEQLEELQTAADIAGENVGYQEQNLDLLRKQHINQSKVFKLQREALEFRSQGAIRSAQVDLANNTSNRSLRRQRFADIKSSVLDSFGVDSINDLTGRAAATGEQALRESGLRGSRRLPGGLSAEEQMRSLRGDSGEFSGATGSAPSEIYKLTGGLGGGSASSPQLTDPLKLPSALSPVPSPIVAFSPKLTDPLETPVINPPVIETPVIETPVIETPVINPPVIETPVINPPVIETPVIKTPVIETPVIETPVIKTPVINPPVIETPVIKTPVQSDKSMEIRQENPVLNPPSALPPSPQSTNPLKLPLTLSPVLSTGISQDFSRALQQATGKGQTTISPTINIPITVNGDQKVGESIKKQVEPRLENIIQQMVNLSRN